MSNKIFGNVVGFVGAKYDTVTLQAMYNEVIEPSPEHWFIFDAENKSIMGLNIECEAEYSSSDVTDLVIPYTINGITIEWIGDNTKSSSAILLPANIENVRLPNCVKHIGRKAFMDNANLKTINIPSSCEKIHQSAFEKCTSLENVITPIKPNYELLIEPYAFNCCGNLNNIDTIIDGIKTISKYCFDSCGTTNVTVSESTDIIQTRAFSQNIKLNSVTILNPNCTIQPNILYFSTKCKVIKGYKNSTAETYAKENGLTFIALDDVSSSGDVDLSEFEKISNKVNAIDEDSTENQYPSAKAVWDASTDLLKYISEYYVTNSLLNETIGEIDSALEEIIAIQNQLMEVSE